MSKQREEFEAWWENKPEPMEWIFWSEEKNSAWAGWQASRAAAVEETKNLREALGEIISSIDSYGCGFSSGSESFWAGVDKARAAVDKALGS